MTRCRFSVGFNERCNCRNAEIEAEAELNLPDARHTMNQVQKP